MGIPLKSTQALYRDGPSAEVTEVTNRTIRSLNRAETRVHLWSMFGRARFGRPLASAKPLIFLARPTGYVGEHKKCLSNLNK
jgi:hypothetical protein